MIAVSTAKGDGLVERPLSTLKFSGYEWQIRQVSSDRGGPNDYDPANAWIDGERRLHLRIAAAGGKWTQRKSA